MLIWEGSRAKTLSQVGLFLLLILLKISQILSFLFLKKRCFFPHSIKIVMPIDFDWQICKCLSPENWSLICRGKMLNLVDFLETSHWDLTFDSNFSRPPLRQRVISYLLMLETFPVTAVTTSPNARGMFHVTVVTILLR